MSVSFAVGSNDLRWTAGSAAAVGTGAFSLYALVQPGVGNNNAGFVAGYATNTLTRGVGESGNHLYGPNDFSPSGFGTLTQGTWYEVMVTKSLLSAPWRMHIRAQGAGSWSHGVATSASNQGNGSAITNFRVGNVGIASANGLVGAWAAWTSELADASIDTIDGTGLTTVAALSPQELVSLENWNGTSGSATLVGTCTFSLVTGTGSTGANPAGFSFSIGGGSTAVTVVDAPVLGYGWRAGAESTVFGLATPDSVRGLGWRSGAETVATGTSASDAPGSFRLRSADGTTVLGVAVTDLPLGFPMRSGGEAVGSGSSAADAPGGFRLRSADGLGILTGLLIPDAASGIRLGAPSANVLTGLVVSDTPGGFRARSATESVSVGSLTPVTVADLISGFRLGTPPASVLIGVPSDEAPVTPIIAPVERVRLLAPVSRVGIVVQVKEVRA